MDLLGRSLLKETDLNADEFLFLIDLARRVRTEKRDGVTGQRLAGRSIALIFEKTSTRTRSAFEVAAHDEGGHVTYLGPGESQLGHKESVKDTARVLGRMFDGMALQPSDEVRGIAAGLAAGSGARLLVTDDVNAGVAGVDFVYTDVWLSLGEPEDQWDSRIDQLLPYQVNSAALKATGNPEVKFMHCLPALHNRDTEVGEQIYARRGLDALEVTDVVFESPASVVFDEAANRMPTIKALMVATVGPRS